MTGFQGFPRQTVRFFQLLARNNTKKWFDAHRDEYEGDVLGPARAFVVAMYERLRRLSDEVNADPRVDRSIFRLHRDVRFSRDKSPFKTHLGIFFWEGGRPRMECPGYYFHLEPPRLMLGAGLYMFPKPVLARYRKAVADARTGAELAKAASVVTSRGYEIGGETLKRVPRGFDAAHPRADLLRHTGLYAGTEVRIPATLHSAGIVDWCLRRYEQMDPVERWLVRRLG
jgi:uncharacterized protein (TIGR02453 family)